MAEPLWPRLRRRFWRLIDRARRDRLRRLAKRRAAVLGAPRRILVVCYGNICRSPYAAAALRRQLSLVGLEAVQVDSAGFFGPGRPADPSGFALGRDRGLDLSDHRSRLVRTDDAVLHDLALVMTRDQRSALIALHGFSAGQVELLGDFDPADTSDREIPDPYGKPRHFFERVFDQLDRAVAGLVAPWTTPHP